MIWELITPETPCCTYPDDAGAVRPERDGCSEYDSEESNRNSLSKFIIVGCQ